MAFDTQILDLVNVDDFTDQAAMDAWATDAVKEIINILPPELKQKCSTISILNASNGTTLDLDGKGQVLQVTRKEASNKYFLPCREISPLNSDLANDSNSIYAASVSDPVYYQVSNSSGASTLFVLPTPTNDEPSNVYYIGYTSVDVSSDSTIANFPDEAEYLVVLYTAIKVAESVMVSEEDPELFAPIIATLKGDYDKGITMLASQGIPKPQKGDK